MKHYEYAINSVWLITICILLWGIFNAVPEKWLIDYQSITIEYSCIDGTQILSASSVRYPKFTFLGSGEDNIFAYPLNGQGSIRRFEFDNAIYRNGSVSDSWDISITDNPLSPGDYILVGEPVIKLFFLSRALDPIESNVFNVTICDQK